jgi:short-subunit dehydrogenase involved in D-alanine esterification of teichoic acids
MTLENRTILITGGSSGMIFELAKPLLERRNVVITTRRSH